METLALLHLLVFRKLNGETLKKIKESACITRIKRETAEWTALDIDLLIGAFSISTEALEAWLPDDWAEEALQAMARTLEVLGHTGSQKN